jgi:sRNA-binding protein
MTAAAKRQAAKNADELVGALCNNFPLAFSVNPRRRQPLKVGIHRDILSLLAVEPKLLSHALRRYTNSRGYLNACQAGAERTGLDGKPSGTVTTDEAEQAAVRLVQVKQQMKERRQAIAMPERKPVPASAPASPQPRRLGLSDLRAAANARKTRNGERRPPA